MSAKVQKIFIFSLLVSLDFQTNKQTNKKKINNFMSFFAILCNRCSASQWPKQQKSIVKGNHFFVQPKIRTWSAFKMSCETKRLQWRTEVHFVHQEFFAIATTLVLVKNFFLLTGNIVGSTGLWNFCFISESSMDCDGKEFICLTIYTYLQCVNQTDGSTRTFSNEIQYCPTATYCDHNYGEYECDSPEIPSNTTSTGGKWFHFLRFRFLMIASKVDNQILIIGININRIDSWKWKSSACPECDTFQEFWSSFWFERWYDFSHVCNDHIVDLS